MGNPEFTREYNFRDGIVSINCRPNSCMFCDHCTDIFYDDHGPYTIICEKKVPDAFETGMLGKCKLFCENNCS